jgi:uncharacterized SAM-binding protein YcdF (DUF218 family)
MTVQEEFVSLLQKQPLKQGDVIFVLQGDGVNRAAHAAKLFREGSAPLVAIVGSANNRAYGSFPSGAVRDEMLHLGIPESAILFEEIAPHTLAEAKQAMQLAQEKGWKTILVLTSPHHQYRAFLTFLKAMRDADMHVELVNAVAPLSMTEENPWGRRADLMEKEFDKIVEYQKQGDVASYDDGIKYLKSL